MRVFRADNGVALDVNAGPDTTVQQLKEALSKIWSIPVPDEILLCEGVKMESATTLKTYGLPITEKKVFLYDRRTLQSDLPPADVVLPYIDDRVPAPVPLPLEQKSYTNPVVWKLMELESEFLERFNIADAIKRGADARVELSRNLAYEQEMMLAALQSSFSPLSEQISQVNQAYDVFLQTYKPLSEQHESLLATFEENMRKLKDTRLHTSLITSSGIQTLMDVVPEIRLRRWAEECASEHSQLKSRVGELTKQFVVVKEAVDMESKKLTEPEYFDRKSLQLQIKKAEDIRADTQTLLQIFTADYNLVKDRLSMARRNPSNGVLDGLADTREKHVNYLAKMRDREQSLKAITQLIALSKSKLAKYVLDRLRAVATLQSKCREVANKVVAFHEAIVRQKQAFFQLIYVQRMPKAYQASLEEVLRRRKYAKKVNFLIQKITEILAKVREDEVAKRKSYLENFGRYIPKDLILGLNENVPAFDITIPNFDTSLPQIENGNSVANMDEFALQLPGFGDDQSGRVSELEKENERLYVEIKELKAAREGQEQNKEVLKLKQSVIEVGELSNDYKKRVESLEAQLAASYARIERAENLVQHFKEKVDSVEKEKQSESYEIESLRKKLEEAQKLVDNFDSTKNTLVELQSVIAKQQQKIEDLNSEIFNSKDHIKTQINKVQELTQQKAQADQQIALISEKMEAKATEIDQLLHSVDYHKAEVSELSDRLSELNKEKQALLNKIDELTKSITKLQEQDQKLKESLDEKSRTVLQQEDRINQLQNASLQKNNNAQEASKGLMNEVERLQSLVREYKMTIEQDNFKMKDLEASVTTYKSRAVKIEEEKKLLNDQLVEATQKSSKAMEEKNWIIRQLNEKLSKLNETNGRLEEEKKKLQLLAAQATDRADRAEKAALAAKPLTNSTTGDDKKYIEAVSALDMKNRQNIELARSIQLLEKKIITTESELSNLRSSIRKVQELLLDPRQSDGEDEDLGILRLKISSLVEDRERLVKEADMQKAVVIEFHMKMEELEKKNQDLKSESTALKMELGNRRPVESASKGIAFSNFKSGDCVLFLPNKNALYEAYPHGNNYFLSPEALVNFDAEKKAQKPICGTVVEVVTEKATGSFNPFKLNVGTTFYEVLIFKE